MRSRIITFFGFTLAGVSSASQRRDPAFLSRRVDSPDNNCGNAFSGGYSCGSTNDGPCCSQYGYCGNTIDFCGAGCQTDFGSCTGTTTQPSADDFMCGPNNGNKLCLSGLCCSQSGYCGSTDDYCGTGCQSTYGICDTGNDTLPTDGGTCGPNFGNAVCTNNQCCSVSGYCGNTEDFCADPNNWLSTLNVPTPAKGPISYTTDIYNCVQSNVVALTYDDGPYLYTEALLDTLKTYGFHATFFMTGNNNGKGEIDTTAPYPSLIQRMIAEGHQVASHTWSHYSLSKISSQLRIAQMVKNEMAFNNIIGMWPTYMRPPYSDCTKASGCWADMQSLGYHRVYFNLDTQDYLNPTTTLIQNSKNVVAAALAGSGANEYLSIQHDIVQQSATNLSSYYFDLIQAKAWRGVTAGECLGDTDRTNWYRSFNDAGSASSSMSSPTSSYSPPTSSTAPSSAAPSSASSYFTSSSSIVSSSPVTSPTSSSVTSKSSPVSTSSRTSSTSSSFKSTSSSKTSSTKLTSSKSSSSISSTKSSSLSSSTARTSLSSTKVSNSSSTIPSTSKSTTVSTSKSSTSKTSSPTSSTTSKLTTTSKFTTSTSITTATPTPTPSSTPSSTATSTSTSPSATAAAAACDFSNGDWCGNINTFNNYATCLTATDYCASEFAKCMLGGLTTLSACTQWAAVCVDLTVYCATNCSASSCSNAAFGY